MFPFFPRCRKNLCKYPKFDPQQNQNLTCSLLHQAFILEPVHVYANQLMRFRLLEIQLSLNFSFTIILVFSHYFLWLDSARLPAKHSFLNILKNCPLVIPFWISGLPNTSFLEYLSFYGNWLTPIKILTPKNAVNSSAFFIFFKHPSILLNFYQFKKSL